MGERVVNVALDTTSLNVHDSIVPFKNILDTISPTKNVVKKYKNLKMIQNPNIRVGLFCNGTFGLDVKKLSKRYKLNIMGVYFSKKFVSNTEKDILPKAIIKGLIEEIAINTRTWNILRRERKYNLNELKLLRIDSDWLYFSIYDELNKIFTIAIDHDIAVQNNDSYLEKMRKIKKMGSNVVVSLQTCNTDYKIINEKVEIFIKKLNEDNYKILTCPVLVMNYMIGFRNERIKMLRDFADYCKNKDIANPLLIIKFAKTEYFSAEIFFDDLLREIDKIFKENK